MFERVIRGGSTEGDDTEEKAELDGSGQGESDQQAADDGQEAATDAGPHGDALGKANDQGHAQRELVEIHTRLPDRAAVSAPTRDHQDGNAADKPSGDDRPESPGISPEEVKLDGLLQRQADDRGGQEGGDDRHRQTFPFGIAAEQTLGHLPNPRAVETEHRNNGPGLDADGEGVGRSAGLDAEQALSQQKVTGGADRKIFGQTLDDPEDECL